MASGYDMRVGDAERDAAANELREHFASGRLTQDELNERLDQTFAAKTRADLSGLFTDLPSSTWQDAPARGVGGRPFGAERAVRDAPGSSGPAGAPITAGGRPPGPTTRSATAARAVPAARRLRQARARYGRRPARAALGAAHARHLLDLRWRRRARSGSCSSSRRSRCSGGSSSSSSDAGGAAVAARGAAGGAAAATPLVGTSHAIRMVRVPWRGSAIYRGRDRTSERTRKARW